VRECEEGADDELGECYKGSFVGVSIDVVLVFIVEVVVAYRLLVVLC
jgi:hypothetical protein